MDCQPEHSLNYLGVDGISMLFVVLNSFTTVMVVHRWLG